MTKMIMVVYDATAQSEQAVLFARDDNRMIMGSAVGSEARWGEDPAKPEIRFFTSHQPAVEYLKEKCREYCSRWDIDFLTESGTPRIAAPQRNGRIV